ncbi:unnamed protein product [Rotaria socialis]|uniref:Protein YIPF3 n=2 Tax=Rotaria socialis TaxID=392032 RepID=A0A820BGD0_9BILA|nr:unnamed protein product [Rotaria socialis]CAF4207322.1 unnamed protein product [Rotaria socialis]CAF4518297.1 unnamed protein product [Rotaria socialis]CAF4536994.1 unnamed protein product [Rotaria socialis]CAF4714223.1 unnamed protein product [Rotaria socialis]
MQENLQRRTTINNNNNNNPQATSLESGMPSVGSIVWTAGRTRAQQAINLYANIDYLRPYFDVEPKEILHRLLHALTPRWPSPEENIKSELYGPSMIVFTLAAILIYQMKLASHSIEDGTLIGTSFLISFGYWIGSSFAISSVSFVCNTHLNLIQILCLNGYALFSHCLVLFLATFIHTGHDHLLFYGLWCIVGGLAAMRMMFVIMARTINPRYRVLLGLFVGAIHMFFLLYLHFAYHELAETVSHAFTNEATGSADLPVIARASQLVDAVTQSKDIPDDSHNNFSMPSLSTEFIPSVISSACN